MDLGITSCGNETKYLNHSNCLEVNAPISVNSIKGSKVPSYCGRYDAPVNGQRTKGNPSYIGVYEAAQISSDMVGSYEISTLLVCAGCPASLANRR